MQVAEAYAELIRRTKETALLGSCAGVLGWDERVNLPPAGGEFRGEQMALIARMTHEMSTDPFIGEALSTVEASKPDGDMAVNVRELRRGYDRAVKLPKALVEELARVTIRAQQAWQEARQADDFAGFQPWLEKVVTLKREEAQAVGYKEHPYNALLDEYEPGTTAADVKQIFAGLTKELVPLIEAIKNSPRRPKTEILHREYPVDLQKIFGTAAAAAIGFDFGAGRLDTTTHPFCSGIGPGDCRITTRYNPKFFNESFFGILHEAGHGIYEQGLDPDHFGTPPGAFCSLGIHESQSRLWENQVGRGPAFWQHFLPRARQVFLTALRDVSFDDFYFAINDVKPSFIRVESDEATYNLHIILRFELELDLLAGTLKPGDLPAAWNEKFEKMFHLKVPDNRQGCLQDIHWSMGGLGYFPTYTLGNLYAAQLMEQARKDLGDLDADFTRGEFSRLKGWLNVNVHKPGRRYRAGELCERVTGQSLSHAPLIRYLRDKYAPLYGC